MPRPSDYTAAASLGSDEETTPVRSGGPLEKHRRTPPSVAVSAPGSPCEPERCAVRSPSGRGRPPNVSGMQWPEEDNPARTPSPTRREPQAHHSMSAEQERVDERRAEAAARHLSRARAARCQHPPTIHPNAPLATGDAAQLLDDEVVPVVTGSKDASPRSKEVLVDQVAKLKQAKRDLRVALDDERQKLQEEKEYVEELEEELTKMRSAVRARESQYAGTTWTMAKEMTSLRAQLAAANDERLNSTSTLEFEKAELQAQNQELRIQTQRWKLHATQATFRGVIRLDAASLRTAWDAWVEWSNFRHEQRLLMKATQRELQSGQARIEALETEMMSLRQQLQGKEHVLEQQQQHRVQSTERHRAITEMLAGRMIKRWQNGTAVAILEDWSAHARLMRRAAMIARRIGSQQQKRVAAVVIEAWRCWTSECTQQRRLVTKMLLRSAHRQLMSAFLAWHVLTASTTRNRAVVAHAVTRLCRARLYAALQAWWTHTASMRSIRLLSARLLSRMRHTCVVSAFDSWVQCTRDVARYRVVVATHRRHWKTDSLSKLTQAFAGWKSRTTSRRQHARAAARCTAALARGRMARIWRSWSAQATQSLTSKLLMQRFLCVLRNSMLASVWRRWRTTVSDVRHGKVLNLRAERMLTRKRKEEVALMFGSWCAKVASVRRSVMLTQRVLGRMMSKVLLAAVKVWADWAAERLHLSALVQRASAHKLKATTTAVVVCWRGWAAQRRTLQRTIVRSTAHFAKFHTTRVWAAWSRLSRDRSLKKIQQNRMQMVVARSKLADVWHKWQMFVSARMQIWRSIARADRRRHSRMVAMMFIFWCDFTAHSLEQMLQREEEELQARKVQALGEQLATSEATCGGLQKQLSEQVATSHQELLALKKQVALEEASCAELRSQLSEQAAASGQELADVRKQRADLLLQIQSASKRDSTSKQLEQELHALKEELRIVRKELLKTQKEHKHVTLLYSSEVVAEVGNCTDDLVAQVVNAQPEAQSVIEPSKDAGMNSNSSQLAGLTEVGNCTDDLVAQVVNAQPEVQTDEPSKDAGINSNSSQLAGFTYGQPKLVKKVQAGASSFDDGLAELAQIRSELAAKKVVDTQVCTLLDGRLSPELAMPQPSELAVLEQKMRSNSHEGQGEVKRSSEHCWDGTNPCSKAHNAGEVAPLAAHATRLRQQQWSGARTPVTAVTMGAAAMQRPTIHTARSQADVPVATRQTVHQRMHTSNWRPPTSMPNWYGIEELKQIRPQQRRARS
eukprot:COSAG02_NODE_76_length_41115_cov_60.967817_3_plen_1253_part_00